MLSFDISSSSQREAFPDVRPIDGGLRTDMALTVTVFHARGACDLTCREEAAGLGCAMIRWHHSCFVAVPEPRCT